MVLPLIVGGAALLAFAAWSKKDEPGEAEPMETGYEDERITQGDFTPGSSVPHPANGNVGKGARVAGAALRAALPFVPGVDAETQEGVTQLYDSIAEAAPAGKGPKAPKPKKPKKPKRQKPAKTPKDPKPKKDKAAGRTARQAKKDANRAAREQKKDAKKKSA